MKESGTDFPGVKQLRLFNSKYPIIAAPMNQVSELALAVAVHNAGGFPSISGYCYESDDDIIKVLEEYVDTTGSSNIILAVDEKSLLNKKLTNTLNQLGISHVLRYFNENCNITDQTRENWRKILDVSLKTLKCQFIEMKNDFSIITDFSKIYFVKGRDGAGRPGVATTKELFDFHKMKTPDAALVPIGGIGTASQVKYYMDNGAVAVSIGTLLAASKESCLTEAVKHAMIAANNSKLSLLDNNLKQQGLIFKEFIDSDTANHTNSLKLGIKSNADAGHIFAGHGIDYINTIDDVSTVILKLANGTR